MHQALSHRSWCGEQDGDAPSNERLEFLGDAVLGLVVAEHTYRRLPRLPRGQAGQGALRRRQRPRPGRGRRGARGRGRSCCSDGARSSSGGRTKASILADALEAMIGAVYLDAGWAPAEELVLRLLAVRIDRAAAEPDDYDHKSRLQELTVRSGEACPATSSSARAPTTTATTWPRCSWAACASGWARAPRRRTPSRRRPGSAWKELHGA